MLVQVTGVELYRHGQVLDYALLLESLSDVRRTQKISERVQIINTSISGAAKSIVAYQRIHVFKKMVKHFPISCIHFFQNQVNIDG